MFNPECYCGRQCLIKMGPIGSCPACDPPKPAVCFWRDMPKCSPVEHCIRRTPARCYVVTVLTFHPRKQKIRFEDRHPTWAWYSYNTSPSSSSHSHNEMTLCARVGDQLVQYNLGREAGQSDGHLDPCPTSDDPDYIAGYWDGWQNMDDWS